MSILRFDPHEEFVEFLKSFNLKSIADTPEYQQTSKRLHKRILGLLMIEYQFQANLPPPKESAPETLKYLEEFRSDLLSSFFIFHIGMYKAAMMSGRSALENLFRVIIGYQGIDFKTIKSVYDLVEAVKTSPLRGKYKLLDDLQNSLFDDYAQLCNYTHSSSEEYLSLERRLANFPKWEADAGSAVSTMLTKIAQRSSVILLVLQPSNLHKMPYMHKDFLLDGLPAKLKMSLREITN